MAKQNALKGGAYGMSVLSYNGAVCHCYYDELDEKYEGLIHLGPYTSNAEGSTFVELEQDFHRPDAEDLFTCSKCGEEVSAKSVYND